MAISSSIRRNVSCLSVFYLHFLHRERLRSLPMILWCCLEGQHVYLGWRACWLAEREGVSLKGHLLLVLPWTAGGSCWGQSATFPHHRWTLPGPLLLPQPAEPHSEASEVLFSMLGAELVCWNIPVVKWVIRPKESLLCTPLVHSKSLWLCSSSTLLFLAGQLILDYYIFIRGTLPGSTWSIHAQNLGQCFQYVSQSNFDYRYAWLLEAFQNLEKLAKWTRSFYCLCSTGEGISILFIFLPTWSYAWFKGSFLNLL